MEATAISDSPPRLDIDRQTLPVEALEDEITTLSASVTVATWRLLVLIAELDRRGKWGSWRLASCAHWLNWKCGIALGAAREKVRVAHALAELPKVSDALARGELSYSKARAITRVATPDSEDYLLMIARHGTAAHVEKLVRTYRRIDRLHEAARANRHHAQRALHWRHDDDGSMLITVRLPVEQGALVLKAIEAAAQAARAERDGADRDATTPQFPRNHLPLAGRADGPRYGGRRPDAPERPTLNQGPIPITRKFWSGSLQRTSTNSPLPGKPSRV